MSATQIAEFGPVPPARGSRRLRGAATPRSASAEDELRELYRLMVLARRLDREASALQRQGELDRLPAASRARRPRRSVARSRSAGGLRVPVVPRARRRPSCAASTSSSTCTSTAATWHGGPYDANAHRFGHVSVPVGIAERCTRSGWAMGARKRRAAGRGARVLRRRRHLRGRLPRGVRTSRPCSARRVVFFCQNNQWAISVPLAQQTAAPIGGRPAGTGCRACGWTATTCSRCTRSTARRRERARAGGSRRSSRR